MQNKQISKVLGTVSNLYQDSLVPVVVTDHNLKILWANQKSIEIYPGFTVPDGLGLVLPSSAVTLIRSLPDNYIQPIVIPIPFSGTEVLFTPTTGGYVVNFDRLDRQGTALRPEGSELLLSSFSNQVRAPLTAIFSALSLIHQNQKVMEIDDMPEMVQTINKNGYQLLRSTMNISRYIKHTMGNDSFNPSLINLTSFLKRLCDACAVILCDIEIAISYDLPSEDVFLMADPDKLAVSILHILSNSCRFTRKENRIDVSMNYTDNQATITISDHGMGIPANIQDRIFEPFFSYDHFGRPFAGDGLGLSIVRYYISQHGGAVALSSAEDDYTTVAINLPIRNQSDLEVQAYSSVADHLRDRFSNMHIILSDSCGCPPP